MVLRSLLFPRRPRSYGRRLLWILGASFRETNNLILFVDNAGEVSVMLRFLEALCTSSASYSLAEDSLNLPPKSTRSAHSPPHQRRIHMASLDVLQQHLCMLGT